MKQNWRVLDANEAVARVAYALSEVIAIYPITPASTMGEAADAWAAAKRPNLWGAVPEIMEMQSEAGAAGALHGATSTGALATSFTSSQGLLLMIPVLYKLAGELDPLVLHIAARSVAAHALSIFGDHSDVMGARAAGCAMLCSSSVQEAADLAAVAHAATLKTRLPFLHFFDGFRTSHEIQRIQVLTEEDLSALIERDSLTEHRKRALSPDHPTLRGSAQNPDVFFQSREAAEPFYRACPDAVQKLMDQLARRTGRPYKLFDYYGHPQAERVIISMGSGSLSVEEAARKLNARGEKVGLIRVRLYRPFDAARLAAAFPPTTRAVAVLDRTKESGAPGEPLYLDVVAALEQAYAKRLPRPTSRPLVIGGRYGLSSKEFTPAMAAAVFAELARESPKNSFTVGIRDDVNFSSLDYDASSDAEEPETRRAIFFGLGSDGTVGASKQTLKIIAQATGVHVQGYSVYDSKKSGSMTVSHLRLSSKIIDAPYLIRRAQFLACTQERLLETARLEEIAAPGAQILLNISGNDVWKRLPAALRRAALRTNMKLYAVDASGAARKAGLGPLTGSMMQACFLSLFDPFPGWLDALKASLKKSYGKKGAAVIENNLKALDLALSGLREIPLGPEPAPSADGRRALPEQAPDFVRKVTAEIMAGRGDELPVSALPADGTFPTGTSRWEKRAIAAEIPVWEESLCIQCNKCALVCPHAAIRAKAYPGEKLSQAPEGFRSLAWKGREFPQDTRYTIQVSPEDCTGCRLCVEVCPAHLKDDPQVKALAMSEMAPLRQAESRAFDFFLRLPQARREPPAAESVKSSQLREPLFEFSGACAACGETPYLKLLTQLFGDRLLIANATGCSSIFGGNLPTTPWTKNDQGRGPAWSNSLFEDNAEFGLGFRLTLDERRAHAQRLLRAHAEIIGPDLARELLEAGQKDDPEIFRQRGRADELRRRLAAIKEPWARDLGELSESLVRKSVWIVGGDGWAYDIGFGGLDLTLRSGRNVKILVLDTQVYSNTGGQASKATPRGATARFASSGKSRPAMDMVLHAIGCGEVYAARVALGADDAQTVRALAEAEDFPGPAIVVAYAHCIAHGIAMDRGLEQQKLAVACGLWPLLRYDPRRAERGENPLRLDSRPPSIPFEDYARREGRFRQLLEAEPERAAELFAQAREDIRRSWRKLEALRLSEEPRAKPAAIS